ncbi:MAG: nuclear transport factor 2 family protein [Bacteroidales bacterium]|nr:nuclear transport factor 2 family protein [Bacteroidales bacterium]
MKKLMNLFLILIALFLFGSCMNEKKESPVEKVDFEKEKMEISQLLDNLVTASETGNFEMIEDIWYPSDDAFLIGTESDEKLEGWDEISSAIKKQFGNFEETLISITDQSIWMNDDATVAWFFEALNYNFVYEDKAMTFEGIRFTGVMQKKEGVWRLVQQHMSIPAQLEMVETH